MKKFFKILLIFVTIFIIYGIIDVIFSNDTSKEFVVCIDAGHGGSDVGATFNNTRYEKDDNLRVANLVKKYLEEQNIKVIMTRDTDKSVELTERCRIANKAKASLFVSIHRNSADSGSGIEIWCNSLEREEDTSLATNILNKLENTNIQSNRGIKYGTINGGTSNYTVLSNTNMPSCLIELGFISDKNDNDLLDKNIDSYAKAIADGIAQEINSKEEES